MGNKQHNATSIKDKDEVGKLANRNIIHYIVIGRHSFEFNYVIGRGGFGKVR